MSDRDPVPRFVPDARAPVRLGERRGRLLVIAAGGLLLALLASSVANTTRVGLRCIDGELVAVRGSLMPAGEEPLDDPNLPPLLVPTAACEDEDLPDLAALRARHRELAHGGDAPRRAEDRQPRTPTALDALPELPDDADEETQAERRALLQTMVDEKVEQARASQQEALRWIERARQAGVDPARLRAAERALGLLAAPVEAVAAPDQPSPTPDARGPTVTQAPAGPSLPRSL